MECEYQGNYSNPMNWGGACVASQLVHEGCPIYVLVPTGSEITPTIWRANQQITLDYAPIVEETVQHYVESIDVHSCDCAPIWVPQKFDRVALTIPNAQQNDTVYFEGAGNAAINYAVIIEPGPCAEAMWPTTFRQATACDRCPDQFDGHPPLPVPDRRDGASCSAIDGGGWLAVLCALVLLHRHARTRGSRRIN